MCRRRINGGHAQAAFPTCRYRGMCFERASGCASGGQARCASRDDSRCASGIGGKMGTRGEGGRDVHQGGGVKDELGTMQDVHLGGGRES